MENYNMLTREELTDEHNTLCHIIDKYRDEQNSLIMARGKPGNEQLNIALPMLDVINSKSDLFAENGVDCRNYGEPTGIIDAKKLFAEYMEISTSEIYIGGSSSLIFMSNLLLCSMLRGVLHSKQPWIKYPHLKFICPVPGYDRHFKMCEYLGIEMISVPLYEDGPDMDMVEQLVSRDDTIKGIWCVPKYSNPTGTSYSDDTVRRLAGMKTAATDFRIFWDNAYAVHYIYKKVKVLNLLNECKIHGNPDRAYMFGSTSKITLPGAGVCFFGASAENIKYIVSELSYLGAGWDKMNMLRHTRFLKNIETIESIMDKHADIIRPHFDIVIKSLEVELSGRGVGSYIKPDGGYFVTYKSKRGCAKEIVSLCADLGVQLTSAGATHPYGKDPDDSFIRIAPTSISCRDLQKAMDIFCIAARYVTVKNLLCS